MRQKTQRTQGFSGVWENIRNRLDYITMKGIEAYTLFSEKDMNVFSGNATLYILMAMVPFFTLAAGMINFLPEKYLTDFCELILSLFPNIPQIQAMMHNLFEQVSPQKGTLVVSISILTMLWSASNGVSALQLGMKRLSESRQSPIRQRLSAIMYTILFILLIAALLIFRVFRTSLSSAASGIASMLKMPEIAEIFNSVLQDGGVITAGALGIILLMMYSFMQGDQRKIRYQLPGAVFATVLWILFSAVYEWFITGFWSASAVYGSLAAIFLTAMWMRTIIIILFLGASLNEVCYRHFRQTDSTNPE